MLKQLNQLSIDTDGRYATATELQFIKDYLKSADQRIVAYEKIRDAEEQIMEEVKDKACSINPKLLVRPSGDVSDFCYRDRKRLLMNFAATMLINDLDRFRDGVLAWLRTLVHAVIIEGEASQLIGQLFSDALEQHLTAEEAKLIMPVIQLNKAFMG